MVERDRSGVLYNTQLIAAPTGLIGGYRKTHVGNSEIHRFSHGDELRVFDYEGVSFGIQICYDNHFPEASRTLALRGAERIDEDRKDLTDPVSDVTKVERKLVCGDEELERVT